MRKEEDEYLSRICMMNSMHDFVREKSIKLAKEHADRSYKEVCPEWCGAFMREYRHQYDMMMGVLK